jgi:RNA polymerase sigma-70 factor, ECF subfamily
LKTPLRGKKSKPDIDPETSDQNLIQIIKDGNPDAISILYLRHKDRSYSQALRIVRDPATAASVVIDAFIKTSQHPDLYNPERGAFNTWIGSVVHNLAIDALRKEKSRDSASLDEAMDIKDPEISTEDILELKLDIGLVQQALAQIPDEQREAVILAFISQKTHPEIANYLGLPLGTVKTRIRLGLKKLRIILEEQDVSL